VSRVVWKYDLSGVEWTFRMPSGAMVRHVAEQDGQIRLWAEVDPSALLENRTFVVAGTGHPLPNRELQFVGSLLAAGGEFVFHVYEALS
jgi:hypothetical protein